MKLFELSINPEWTESIRRLAVHYSSIKEDAIKERLFNILGRQPTLEDAKDCQMIFFSGTTADCELHWKGFRILKMALSEFGAPLCFEPCFEQLV